MDDEQQIWIDAAKASLKEAGEASPHELVVEQVADLIEEMASMDPRLREEFAADYDGIVKAALDDWIEDSRDEGDIERHAEFDDDEDEDSDELSALVN